MNGPIESTFSMIADYRHPRKSVPRTSRKNGGIKTLIPRFAEQEPVRVHTVEYPPRGVGRKKDNEPAHTY